MLAVAWGMIAAGDKRTAPGNGKVAAVVLYVLVVLLVAAVATFALESLGVGGWTAVGVGIVAYAVFFALEDPTGLDVKTAMFFALWLVATLRAIDDFGWWAFLVVVPLGLGLGLPVRLRRTKRTPPQDWSAFD